MARRRSISFLIGVFPAYCPSNMLFPETLDPFVPVASLHQIWIKSQKVSERTTFLNTNLAWYNRHLGRAQGIYQPTIHEGCQRHLGRHRRQATWCVKLSIVTWAITNNLGNESMNYFLIYSVYNYHGSGKPRFLRLNSSSRALSSTFIIMRKISMEAGLNT